MSDLKLRAMQTLSRLRDEKTLTEDDFELLIPVIERLVSKLSDTDRIKFQHVFGGYVVGSMLLSESLGLKYIQYLLLGTEVSCLHLTSGPALPKESLGPEARSKEAVAAIYYEDDTGESGYSASNIASASQVFGAKDPLMDAAYIRSINKRITELQESGESDQELAFLEELLSQDTFNGHSKANINEREKARQSVRKVITSAIARLIENPETKSIGLHLQDNIKFGHDCKYVGKWKWSY